MKKLRIFILSIASLFVLFLIILLTPKDYTKTYELDNVKITESYHTKEKYYYFTFNYNDVTLDYLIESNFKNGRGLITKVDIASDEENNFCIIPTSKKLEMIPLCYQNEEKIHINLVNNELKSKLSKSFFKEENKIDTYEDIEIYNKDYNYFIWNYNGFYYINKDIKNKIKIFDKELYTINLVGYTKDYLVIADYDSNYTFNKFYTIDYKKGKLTKHDLDRNIYFDSYFPGYEKNKLYIVDNKEETMYEFNAKNGKLEKISAKMLKNNAWEKVSIKTLLNKNETFTYNWNYEYKLEDNNIYLNYKNYDIKTLVTKDVTNTIRIDNKDIYYLKNDTLYHFNETTGEEKLLTYFEWNFNDLNMIYITEPN